MVKIDVSECHAFLCTNDFEAWVKVADLHVKHIRKSFAYKTNYVNWNMFGTILTSLT